MIEIALIEDNKEYALMLKEKILETDFKDEISVNLYLNPIEFLDGLNSGKRYHVCFSDVIMPEMDGVKLAEEIRKIDSKMLLIFLSSYLEYATDGYKVNAFDYLLKGRVEEKWDRLVKRIIKRLEDDREKVYRIITPNSVIVIPLDDIVYIYKSGNYCNFVLMDRQKNAVVRKSIWKLEEELAFCKYFILVKRGYIINIKKITEYRANEIIMKNGDKIPIGRMHVSKVKDRVMEYMEGLE